MAVGTAANANMLLRLASISVALAMSPCHAQMVTREIRGHHTLVRDILLEDGTFSFSRAEKACRNALAAASQYQFVQFRVFGDLASAQPLPKHTHISFRFWRSVYEEMITHPLHVAEVISISSNSVLRYRDAERMDQCVLEGSNPLEFVVDGARLQILEISVTTAPIRPKPFQEQAQVFVRTSAPLSESLGRKLYPLIEERLPLPVVAVRIRHDGWFIGSLFFPIRSPFVPDMHPPTEAAYLETPEIACGSAQGRIWCFVSGRSLD